MIMHIIFISIDHLPSIDLIIFSSVFRVFLSVSFFTILSRKIVKHVTRSFFFFLQEERYNKPIIFSLNTVSGYSYS